MIKFISTQLNGSNNIVEILEYISGLSEIYFDYETTSLCPYLGKPILLAVGNQDIQYVIDLRSTDKQYIIKLFANNKDKLWIAHNAKFEYKFTKVHYHVELRNLYCTMIASQVIYNGFEISHSLKECMLRHFGIKLNKDERKSFEGMDDRKAFSDNQIVYVAEDIAFLPKLKARQLEVCPDIELKNYLFEIEFPFIKCLGRAEVQGVHLDINDWKEVYFSNLKKAEEAKNNFKKELTRVMSKNLLRAPFKKDTSKTKKKRQKLAYQQALPFPDMEVREIKTHEDLIIEELNLGSPNQIKEVFERLGLNLEDTNESTFNTYLLNTKDNRFNQLIEYLLQIREYEKAANTYGIDWQKYINPITKNIHTNYGQAMTDTLRVSSEHPNLMNIPKLNIYRNCFKAKQNYKFAIIDYESQEVNLAGSQSKDPLLIAANNQGLDIHSLLANDTYNIIYKKLGYIPNHGSFKSKDLVVNEDNTIEVSKIKNKGLRQEHKSLLFAKFYKAGAKRFMQVLNIPKEVAYEVFNNLNKKLNVLEKYQQGICRTIDRTLTIIGNPITKTRKYFEGVKKGTMEMYEAHKQGCNFPIQNLGAIQKKHSWVNIDKFFYHNGYYEKYPDIGVVLDIHDRQNCCV